MGSQESIVTTESLEARIVALERALAEKEKENQQLRNENASLEKAAYIEPLTGLLNRRGLEHRFNEYLRAHEREQRYIVGSEPKPPTYSVIMVDLKGLKAINDTQGHEAGDMLIRQAAEAFRPTDICARTGGDEFVIILTDTDEHGARMAAERITESFPPNLHCRMGIATSGDVAKTYGRDVTLREVMEIADNLSNDARGKKETRENYAKQSDILALSDVVYEMATKTPRKNGTGMESAPAAELENA